jgi:hypothetical protein
MSHSHKAKAEAEAEAEALQESTASRLMRVASIVRMRVDLLLHITMD